MVGSGLAHEDIRVVQRDAVADKVIFFFLPRPTPAESPLPKYEQSELYPLIDVVEAVLSPHSVSIHLFHRGQQQA